MYDVHIEVESLVYIYVYVGSRTIFFPVNRPMFCLKWSTGTGGKRGQRVQQASVDLDARHSRMTQSLQFGHFRNPRIHHWINPIEFQLEMTYYYLSLLQVFSYIKLYHTNTRASRTTWCFLNRFWTKRGSFSINKMIMCLLNAVKRYYVKFLVNSFHNVGVKLLTE